ncbi:MAG: hypothetical protein KDC84_00725 [Crocinitomicaceae bacterium]|nr:hypothetical protein [Crocinitomicaceae bacterium]
MKSVHLIIILLFLASCNREKIKLGIKLEPGSKHITEAKILIGENGQFGRMEFTIEDEVVSADESGTHQMNFYYRRMSMEIQGQSYDSDFPDQGQFSRLVHQQLSFLFNKPMKGIVKSNGETKIIEDFTQWPGYDELNPKIAKSFEESFSHRNISLPTDEITEGDSWTANVERESNGMLMDMDMTYTLKSVSDDEIVIDLRGTMKSKSGMSMTGNITGEMILDGQTHYNKSVKMDFDMKAQGQSIPMSIVMETTKEE